MSAPEASAPDGHTKANRPKSAVGLSLSRRLSDSAVCLAHHYNVVVVGSGYGGAITAARLASTNKSVCVLERGREFPSGTFPINPTEAKRETQLLTAKGQLGRRTGLYDVRLNGDMQALVGCGLGGTSLINANVAVRPDPRVFEDERFPRDFRKAVDTELEEGFAAAEQMLGVKPYPIDQPALPKLKALFESGHVLGRKAERAPLAVTFEDGPNAAGVQQQACTLCGDCVSGCNFGAKNTLDRNYLQAAWAAGAQLVTGIDVRWISRAPNGEQWLIHYLPQETGREAFEAPEMVLSADVVVLAAGSLGSTEILLRSREKGLAVSNRLGLAFSGNADVLGFGYNADREIRGVGAGDDSVAGLKPVGPCITGMIDSRDGALDEGLLVEDGSMPGALERLLPGLFGVFSHLVGKDTDTGVLDRVAEVLRAVDSQLRGSRRGALRNTQTFLVMGHDGSDGKVELVDDRACIKWNNVGERAVFGRIDSILRAATQAIGGTYVKNPLWTPLGKHRLVTVHPLGGCSMGEGAETGVVDHLGRVFCHEQGTNVHPGLLVCDGSVLPRSLGVNPLLTISAIAERCAAAIVGLQGWETNGFRKRTDAGGRHLPSAGLQFTERMVGYLERSDGHRDDTPFEFVLTVRTENLDATLTDPLHEMSVFGTVQCPALGREALTCLGGTLHLLYEEGEGRRLRYTLPLLTQDGRRYTFNGIKKVESNRGRNLLSLAEDVWVDTTTLSFSLVHEEAGAQVGQGTLRIRVGDLIKQLNSIQPVVDVGRPAPRTWARSLGKFLRFFSEELWETYAQFGCGDDTSTHFFT